LYALCRAGTFDAAASMAREHFGGTPQGAEDRAFLEWLSTSVGFVPSS